ncbi:glycosyltransferase [Micromonospora sp. DT81.3]|uniref:glycosyltransferase n=1 Tax=Micromonospora sp. DT81.3 TaxID=3416523 RepID=UPI003CF822B7
MQSFGAPRATTNPYIVMLKNALQRTPELEHVPFSWRTALLGSYDVFHVHWGDTLLAGRRWYTRGGKRVALLALVVRLKLARTAVVQTVHNVSPREDRGADALLLRALDRRTTLRVRLSETTPEVSGIPSALVPLGHYRDWFALIPKADVEPHHLAYVGLIKPYKGVEELIAAFEECAATAPELRLTVAGKPSDPAVARLARSAAQRVPALRVELRYISEEELVETVTSSSLVVLPYRHMHNSSAALAALSLDRPVLVPDNDTTRSLAKEVGEGWVHFFDGEITAEVLLEAAARTAEPRQGRPDLSRRDWDDAGAAHAAAYRAALAARGRGRTADRRPAS